MRPTLPDISRFLLLVALFLLVFALQAFSAPWNLPAEVRVTSQGVLLADLFPGDPAVPTLQVTNAPEPGKAFVLTRAQIADALRVTDPNVNATNWTGATQVRISRKLRRLDETELVALLSEALQTEFIRDRGTVELKLNRPWTSVNIPDESFSLKVSDFPANGLQPRALIKFTLRSEGEVFGTWTASVDAKVWQEVWVARSPLVRGTQVRDADLVRERRDVLTIQQPLAQFSADDDRLDVGESVTAGSPIYARMIRLRPVVRRGKIVDALVRDGALSISVQAEALDDGAPGQTVRLRNLKSKREFRGKVQDEQTIVITL